MLVNKINEMLNASCEEYIKYLTDNKLDMAEMDSVCSALKLKNNCYALTPKNPAFMCSVADDNTVRIKIGKHICEKDEVHIVAYDKKNNMLLVKEADGRGRLEGKGSDEIKILTDITFLIRNVQRLGYSGRKCSDTETDCEPVPVFTQMPTANQEQLDAIKCVLDSDISCVEGAGGTGKTSVVLAYSIIECLARGEKVLLTATDNEMADKALATVLTLVPPERIRMPKIMRIGAPTPGFKREL